ncbi:hypothetical protein GFH48_06465 [Streptomyces fagopyri]|uniref:MYND-type domain-containing protein n=1 Tax=Streptomyces fagopyri TaxID=2662397 RepID=A0A5Q0L7P0_9ACTN|nr:hypothetical protein GFH48_06465 [Streptomyces fagopyri]
MSRKSRRRCAQCREALPAGASASRRYCDSACRSRHWRRVRRPDEIYRRAVEQNCGVVRGEFLRGQGRCPVCKVPVPLRKRTDSVYCSPKCRTRAWRRRRDTTEGA